MTFGDWFIFFLIWVPLMLVWVFTLADIFSRPDLSGWAKALWVVAVFVFPWLGVLVYLISRPPTAPGAWAARSYESAAYAPAPVTAGPTSTAQDLERLARLRSEGLLTEEEFQAAKSNVLAASQPGEKAA